MKNKKEKPRTLTMDGKKGSSKDKKATQTISPIVVTPEVIGNYRLLQKLGVGGMGEVYEAEQVKPIQRKVALKLIKWGMDTKQVIARFESERQALALMNHTNIAKVYDAGATEKGRPYFVMEHVKGVRINDYCDKTRMDTSERLKLFTQVCDGVQHAHQKGIIHRDIKASNVLVTIQDDKPVPKIIDFGVAKATAQRLTERTVFTEMGQLIGTPGYMSPEQAEMTGLDVDTRTDVYSLGVLLYELLVGVLPFESEEIRKGGFDEIRRKVREEEPPKPSTRLTTPGFNTKHATQSRRTDLSTLTKQLKGELDWITMKAMAKDRTHRYASASELSSDILRYLKHEPVVAGPPSAMYRLKKYIRRHKTAVAAAALVVLAMLIGIIGTSIGLVKAVKAEKKAKEEAVTAQQVSDFLVELFEVSDPSEARGNTITAREVLDRGAEKIDKELAEQPLIQARLMETMSGVYTGLGLYKVSTPMMEKALAIRQKEQGDDNPDVASDLHGLGDLFTRQGEYEKAERFYQHALEIREKVFGPDHIAVARTLNSLAGLYRHQGRYAEAIPPLKRSLSIKQNTLGPDHPDLTTVLYNLAVLYRRQGKYDEAEPLLKRALDIREKQLGPDHPAVARVLNSYAITLFRQKKYEESKPLYERSLALKEKTLGPDHPDVANSLDNLAIFYAVQREFEKAEPFFERALAIREKAYKPDHPKVAASLNNLASLYIDQKKFDEAEPLVIRSLETKEKILKPNHPDIALGCIALAKVYKNQKKYTESEAYYERGLAILEKVWGPDHPELTGHLRGFANLYTIQEKYGMAKPRIERSVTIEKKVLKKDDPKRAMTLILLATINGHLGNNREAELHYQSAFDIFEKSETLDNPVVAFSQACYWAVLGNSEKAIQHLKRSLELGFSSPFFDDPDLRSLKGNPEFEALVNKFEKNKEEKNEK